MKKYDVIIVGASTAGSFFARRMAEKGFNILVIDKSSRDKISPEYDVFHMEKKEMEDQIVVLNQQLTEKSSQLEERTHQLQEKQEEIDNYIAETRNYDVVLHVKPEKANQVRSSMIDGKKCIVIPMDEDEQATLNGIHL